MIYCDGKECGAQAVCHPILVLRAPRLKYPDADPIRVMFPLNFCAECRDRITFHDLIDDIAWAKIAARVRQQGGIAPEREATTVEFMPIGKRMEAAQA